MPLSARPFPLHFPVGGRCRARESFSDAPAFRATGGAWGFFLLADFFYEVMRQERNIFQAVAKRRRSDRDYVQAVIEILAELSFADFLDQVDVRCRDQADVDSNGF